MRRGIVGVEGLDLELAEDADGPSLVEDRHDVVDELGQRASIGVEQQVGRPLGDERDDRNDGLLAKQGRDHLDEGAGDRADGTGLEGQVHLVARGPVGSGDRQLHVPALVAASGAVPKRDAPAEQRERSSVVVDGPHAEGVVGLDASGDAGRLQVGHHEEAMDPQLALDLAVRRGLGVAHGANPPLRLMSMRLSW
jgi:hypothetical protein